MHKKWVILLSIVFILIIIGLIVGRFDVSEPSDTPAGSDEVPAVVTEDIFTRITNVSKYPVAPGVLVVHNSDFSMNFFGGYAPAPYEALAETGDPSGVIDSARASQGVYDVLRIDALQPQDSKVLTIPASNPDALLSYMAMIIPTNDGVVLFDRVPLYGEGGSQQIGGFLGEIMDMGTEQNSPIGSGFAGGQPDPSRGNENIDNGVATNDPVDSHLQFYDDPVIFSQVVRIDLNS